MRETILELVENSISKQSLYNKLTSIFKCGPKKIAYEIKKVELEGCIFYDESTNKYIKMPSNFFIASIFKTKGSKTNYIIDENGKKILLYKEYLNNALPNDIVVIEEEDSYHKVKTILDRSNTLFFAEVKKETNKMVLKPINYPSDYPIKFNDEFNNCKDGDVIKFTVSKELVNKKYLADLHCKVSHKYDPNKTMINIALKNDLRIDFRPETYSEVHTIPNTIENEYIADRMDFRNILTVTIDCDETKDRDDAFSICKNDQGYLLRVHISDVPHYVPITSSMFKDAAINCHSFYFADKVIPMLHQKLSNGICSLHEKVDRLTRTVSMQLDEDGNLLYYGIYKSVINSDKQMSYSDVDKVLNENIIPEGYEDFVEILQTAKELSKKLTKQSKKRGAIKFFSNDYKHIKNEEDITIEINHNSESTASNMIEQFMVLTNTTVAKHLNEKGTPIYRCHDNPYSSTIMEVKNQLHQYGFDISQSKKIDAAHLQSELNKLKYNENFMVASNRILRSMCRAYYTTKNIGHYGLMLNHYCHFTSPIRRLPDYMTHIALDFYDITRTPEEKMSFFTILQTISELASEKERCIDAAEKEINQLSLVEYMESKIGNRYEVFINNIYNQEIEIISNEIISGLIDFHDFDIEVIHYDKNHQTMVGQKTNWHYKPGDKLLVEVSRVSYDKIFYKALKNLSHLNKTPSEHTLEKIDKYSLTREKKELKEQNKLYHSLHMSDEEKIKKELNLQRKRTNKENKKRTK